MELSLTVFIVAVAGLVLEIVRESCASKSRKRKARQMRPILPDDPITFALRDSGQWRIHVVKLCEE